MIQNIEPNSKYCFLLGANNYSSAALNFDLPEKDSIEIVGGEKIELQKKSQQNLNALSGYFKYTPGSESSQRKLSVTYNNGTEVDKSFRWSSWIEGDNIISVESNKIGHIVIIGLIILLLSILVFVYFAFWKRKKPSGGYSLFDGIQDQAGSKSLFDGNDFVGGNSLFDDEDDAD